VKEWILWLYKFVYAELCPQIALNKRNRHKNVSRWGKLF